MAAIEHGQWGVYNVVDDEPARVAEWLPALAATLGAKKPMHVPRFVGRLLTGEVGVAMMTELPGASNAKAKRELGWIPGHPRWRQGFREPTEDPRRHRAAAGPGGHVTDRDALLDELRPTSFAIAYRMLGSVSEAEDVVQEALLRVHQSLDAGEDIASPRAFVTTMTTRLAITELQSARARREHYVGDWLPEPIVTDGRAWATPAQHAETADSLSLALLVLLETLRPSSARCCCCTTSSTTGTPNRRVIGKTEDNARQLAARARKHVTERRLRFKTSREHHRDLVAGSSRRPSMAISTGSSHCCPRCRDHRRRRRQGACAGSFDARSQPGRAHVGQLAARVGAVPGGAMRPVEVNGGPGAIYLDAQGRVLGVGRWRSPTARSADSARSSIPRSSPTSARSAT